MRYTDKKKVRQHRSASSGLEQNREKFEERTA